MSNIALFDADGTLHSGFSIFPLYDAFTDEGIVSVADNNRLKEVLDTYNSGESEYHVFAKDTLLVAADSIKGQKLSVAISLAGMFFSNPDFPWYGYVSPLMQEIESTNTEAVLVTAEPQFIAEGITRALPFSKFFSSEFGVDEDGVLLGNVMTVLGSTQKGAISKDLTANAGISFGFGDSEGDIGMLEIVDTAVCINPTDELRNIAMTSNWNIAEDPELPINVF